ncbi:MAG: DUF4293 domain-containing protein [Saprospiraceae bacterium]|nr:DUF4293 domain-containing protein [Saprospiraceae bacterium]
MIQRIQSIYLLLASLAGFGQFAVPYLSTPSGDPATVMPALTDQVFNPFDNFGLLGLSILSGLISFIAIFIFKNRGLQGRITGGALLCSALLAILLGISTFQILKAVPAGGSVHYQAGLVLPAVALVLQWLAGRSIKKDDQLVRSMDRLR